MPIPPCLTPLQDCSGMHPSAGAGQGTVKRLATREDKCMHKSVLKRKPTLRVVSMLYELHATDVGVALGRGVNINDCSAVGWMLHLLYCFFLSPLSLM